MHTLVLLRHGESVWNKDNRFTGWTDVGLSEKGFAEAQTAGRRLREAGFGFDLCHTSVLKRAIKTLWLAHEELDLMYLPVYNHWRLNERHYGALQGLNKAETAEQHGIEQVNLWRRSYDVPPPPLALDDPQYPGKDPRYAALPVQEVPLADCLKDTIERMLPYAREHIAPTVRAGNRVLIAVHGNSLRGLVKYIDNVPNDRIAGVNIPTGIPLVYEFEDDLTPIRSFYLGDPEVVKQATQAVADQVHQKT